MKITEISVTFVSFLTSFGGLPTGCGFHLARGMSRVPKLGVMLFSGMGVLAPAEVAVGGCVTPPAGLISWWRAEGDATDALSANNGTLHGEVAFAAGEVGQAFSFNGSNASVQVPDSASLDFASNAPVTIELWAYRTGAETTMYLLRQTECGSRIVSIPDRLQSLQRFGLQCRQWIGRDRPPDAAEYMDASGRDFRRQQHLPVLHERVAGRHRQRESGAANSCAW